MAALKPAVDRITYIITGEGKRIASPGTISGQRATAKVHDYRTGTGCIFSYQKCVGQEQPDGSWRVNDEKDSRTTNRHVQALCAALDNLGISYERGPLW